MEGSWTSVSLTAWANWANLAAAVEETAALLRAPGLCLTSSWRRALKQSTTTPGEIL